jgi:hypothetical protein
MMNSFQFSLSGADGFPIGFADWVGERESTLEAHETIDTASADSKTLRRLICTIRPSISKISL